MEVTATLQFQQHFSVPHFSVFTVIVAHGEACLSPISVAQPGDHEVGPGVAPVSRKSQCQVVGRSEYREDRRGMLWLDIIR